MNSAKLYIDYINKNRECLKILNIIEEKKFAILYLFKQICL